MSITVMYLLVIFIPSVWYLYSYFKKEKKSIAKLEEAKAANLIEPTSLHPVFSTDRCIGCGSCVPACPESAIGLIKGKGVLIAPTKCIGHGACVPACPVKGIGLVFGTEKRGMDIPQVNPSFETNVPGIFIAGELGGMGLIRKSALQGKEAIASIAKKASKDPNLLDVVIVGIGPAGLSASLAAKEKKLKSVSLEQEDSLGGAVFHYPRNKIAMTQPVILPIVGEIKIFDITKEELLDIWNGVVKKAGLKINFKESMVKIIKLPNEGFEVVTNKKSYKTKNILLSIGRRGTPRKLECKGEDDFGKVVYRLIDAAQYKGKKCIVVGGGDSALEAAIALAAEKGTEVILSYRSEAFNRVKEKNRELLAAAEKSGKLKVMLKSGIKEVKKDTVIVSYNGENKEIPNDALIVCAGGILPTPMLKEIGIQVETHTGDIIVVE